MTEKKEFKGVKKCPVCGEEGRVVNDIIKDLKTKIKLEEMGDMGAGMQLQLLLPSSPLMTRMLTVAIDICSNPECGAVYCIGANMTTVANTFKGN